MKCIVFVLISNNQVDATKDKQNIKLFYKTAFCNKGCIF